MIYLKGRRFTAFTLSEVLVALSIVGVIASITLPTLVTNIQDALRFHSATTLTRKFSKSIELMRSVDKLTPYSSTTDFVKELQNFMRIAKVCDQDHITECWPYVRIKLRNEGYYDITSIKNGNVAFNMNNKDINGNPADYSSKVVAIQIADGTSAIIAYNKSCDPEDKAIENCYVALFEINGKTAPNTIGQDAILINAKRFADDTYGLNSTTDNTNQPPSTLNIPTNIECTGNICSRTTRSNNNNKNNNNNNKNNRQSQKGR